MSDPRRPLDRDDLARSLAGLARLRGIILEPGRADAIADLVTPTLTAFAELAGELTVDDDMYEFRRLLGEAARV